MLTGKSWQESFFENFVRQDENKGESKWCITEPWVSLAISAGGVNNKLHFSKLRQVISFSESFSWPASATTVRSEVEYITNDRPDELLTRI